MKFEFTRKNPGYKLTLWFGKTGQFTIYIRTNSHPFIKFYFFK